MKDPGNSRAGIAENLVRAVSQRQGARITKYQQAGRAGMERGVVAEDGCREYDLRTVLAEYDLL